MKRTAPHPDPIDLHDALVQLKLRALCRAGETLRGTLPASRLPRLAESLLDGAASIELAIDGARVVGPDGAPQDQVELRSNARLTLACQRCLAPLEVAIDGASSFVLVRDEAAADAWDERHAADDAAPEPLVADKHFDTLAWVEDELLLALPLAPRHDGPCPAAAAVQEHDADAADGARSPFAALASLSKGKADSPS